ncbi:MAG: hypothetical protein M1602_06675 [Firmicutes bacterium]|nr:hypothetical protein [Bacillota bacterium]
MPFGSRRGVHAALAVIALTAFCTLASAAPALANGLPLGALGVAVGGAICPAENTPLAVVHEALLLDLRSRDGSHVRATYRMRNDSGQAVQIPVGFPVPMNTGGQGEPIGTWPEVRLDGTELAVAAAQQPVALAAGEGYLNPAWLDPFTGETYVPPYARQPRLVFAAFTVDFAPGQERTLQVEYGTHPAFDTSRFVGNASRLDYLLLPARHWASFGSLDVEVLAPKDRTLRASLSLRQTEPGRYTAAFDGLPEQNLSVYLAPGRGSGFPVSWWWRRSSRAWLLAVLLLAGTLAGAAVRARVPRKSWLRMAGYVLTYGSWLAFVRLTPHYLFRPDPIGWMTTWFLYVPGLIALALGLDVLARRILGPRTRNAVRGA